MTLDELKEELNRRQALIVHFSHHAAMRGELNFPTDMLQVLNGEPEWVLSCSVLTPGHAMDVVGSVGVILQPQTVGDVLGVHCCDAGSWSDGQQECSLGEKLSEAALDRSLTEVQPGDYNEWRVRGAKPVGVFVLHPTAISVRRKFVFKGSIEVEETLGAQPITLACVRQIFAGWPISTMGPSGPIQI